MPRKAISASAIADVDVGVDAADQREDHEEDHEQHRDEVERHHPVGAASARSAAARRRRAARTIRQSAVTASATPRTPVDDGLDDHGRVTRVTRGSMPSWMSARTSSPVSPASRLCTSSVRAVGADVDGQRAGRQGDVVRDHGDLEVRARLASAARSRSAAAAMSPRRQHRPRHLQARDRRGRGRRRRRAAARTRAAGAGSWRRPQHGGDVGAPGRRSRRRPRAPRRRTGRR